MGCRVTGKIGRNRGRAFFSSGTGTVLGTPPGHVTEQQERWLFPSQQCMVHSLFCGMNREANSDTDFFFPQYVINFLRRKLELSHLWFGWSLVFTMRTVDTEGGMWNWLEKHGYTSVYKMKLLQCVWNQRIWNRLRTCNSFLTSLLLSFLSPIFVCMCTGTLEEIHNMSLVSKVVGRS